MPPFLALSISLILTIGLVTFDYKKSKKVSNAIWIPIIWMVICGSRLVSQWIQWKQGSISIEALQEGNSLDRVIFIVLIFAGLVILSKRKINLNNLFSENLWLMLFIVFCALSISWSDYPFVSFKRWVKELGNIVMVLVILTEAEKVEVLKVLNRRFAYFLVPLSIVLNKYFPHLSKSYDYWSGQGYFVGVTTSKNMLGNLCLICSFFFIWDILSMIRKHEFRKQKIQFFIDINLLAMCIYLLNMADSATSTGVLIIGTATLLLLNFRIIKKYTKNVGIVFAGLLGIVILFVMVTNILEVFVTILGRDMTFTTRIFIWEKLINLNQNPILGSGYESFWLGENLKMLWTFEYLSGLNQAHNGYLETYLNLGLVGLAILILVIFSSVKKAFIKFPYEFDFAQYRIGLIIIVILYNITEAAFKGIHLVWFIFLIACIDVNLKRKHQKQIYKVVKQYRPKMTTA